MNGTDSNSKEIQYGVPQGSILGPLLFVIYTNDLQNLDKLAKFILYADDANIIRGGGMSLNLGGPLLNFHLQCSLGGAARHLARTHSQVHFGLAI